MHENHVSSTSIDSLRLSWELPTTLSEPLPEFRVVRRGSQHAQTVLWRDEGEAVRGSFACWREGVFRFRLSRYYLGGPLWLSVWFSLPSWKWGHNAAPTTADDLRGVLDEFHILFDYWGLPIAVGEGQVNEAHVFRNVIPPRPVRDYLPVLLAIEPLYSKDFGAFDFTTGVMRGNKSSGWCIYNKNDELAERAQKGQQEAVKGLEWLQNQHPDEWLRFEWRLKKADKVRQQLQCGTVSDLLANYHRLADQLDGALLRHIFRHLTPRRNLEAPGGQWIASVTTVSDPIAKFTRHWQQCLQGPKFVDLLAAEAYQRAQTQIGTSQINLLLKASCPDSSLLARQKTKLREATMCATMENGVPFARLYEELKSAALQRSSLIHLPAEITSQLL